MSSNAIQTKQVFFIDSAVPDSGVIVANLATDAVYYLLDATQDGLQQIADILAEYSSLDAIHVISHGSPGSLQLGNGVVTQTILDGHSAALSTIGGALTDTGDLLLYGCNVAQGEVGQAFIQQLAAATGADVAASDDLTGAAAQDGDWVLEATTSLIEATALNLEEASYAHTLQIATTNLNFSALDKNMWGAGTALNLDVTWDDLLFTKNITQSFSNSGFSGTADLQANAGLVAHLAASTGDVDLNYQMVVNPQTPDVVKSGEYFIFDTSSWSLTDGQLQSLGPDIASTEFTLDFLFNVSGGLHDLQYDPPLFDPITFDPLTVTPINLDQNIVTINTGDPSYELTGTYGGLSFAIPGAVTTDSGTQTSSQSLTPLVAYGLSSTPLGNLNLDLDALAHGLFPATIPSLDYSITRGDFNLNLNLLDLQANLDASVAQKFTFTPTTIWADLTSSYLGEHRYGQLGEQFIFSTPTTGSGDVTITANYSIDGVLRNQTGLALNASLDVKALDLNINGYGIDWSPFGGPLYEGSFPDGGLPIGTPLYLYDQSYQWNGFDSETATYNVAYSNTATSGGQLTSTDSSWTLNQTDIIGTSNVDTLYGNDLDNNVQGLAGNDRIYAGAGNDVINPGDGNDTVYAGTGNDTLNISGNSGFDTVDGGTGNDTLNLEWSSNSTGSYLAFSVQKTDSSWIHFGKHWTDNSGYYGNANDTTATIESVLGALTSSPLQYRYSLNTNSSVGSGEFSSVTWKNLEVSNVKGNANDDFIVYQGGTEYVGNGGVDTFFADFSSWTEVVTWINGKNATISGLSDEAVTILGTTHQVKVSGMERLLLLTGSGNDTIVQNVTGTHDEFRLGAGDDSLTLGGLTAVSDGNDSVDLGTGADTLNISGSSGKDVVDFGAGNDVLNLNWSGNSTGSYLAFSVQKTDSSWVHFGKHWTDNSGYYGNANDTTATIESVLGALTSSPLQYRYSLNTNSSVGSGEFSSVTWKNLEVSNVKGNANDDFIVYQSGTEYVGNGGVDTFFADLSSWTEAVTWTNGRNTSSPNYSDEAVSTLGATHQVKVSGMERLLLLTGSGNDTIVQNVTGTHDEFRLGAGDDSLTLGGLTAVSDGNDSVDLGTGADILNISGSSGKDVVDFGAGNDVLNLNWSGNSTGSYLAFSVQKTDSSWIHFGKHWTDNSGYYGNANDTAATIESVLGAFSSSPLQYRYSLNTYSSGGSGEFSSVTWKNLEVSNVKGNANDDFIVYQGGTEYVGNGGVDTFFADFSSWTEVVTWINGKNATTSGLSDETVTILGTTHQVKVSGMERLLLLTGSGNDTIVQNVTGTHDEFRLGAGDDSLTLGGLTAVSDGNDSVDLGTGADTLNISGSSGKDVVDFGAGNDVLNLNWSGNSTGSYLAFSVQKTDSSWIHFGKHWTDNSGYYGNANDTAATIESVLGAFSSSPLQYRYSLNTYSSGGSGEFSSVTWKNLEVSNVKGNANDDFIVYQGGTEYVGNGGVDTFFADFSSWTEVVTWINGKNATTSGLSDETVTILGTTHQVKVSGMERLLLLTGSGNDTIVQNVTGTNDEFRTGAGNDTIAAGDGSDYIDGGNGDDFLDGGIGVDTLIGGLGNDIFVVDNTGDVVTENASEGTDTVRSSITYTLGTNIENLTLMGTAVINGTGNALDNLLTGNSGNNTLNAGSGDDFLDGGTGADTLIGGLGNDIFVVDNTSDVVTENANAGTDTVRSSITYTLGTNLENLALTGTASIDGTGNALDNILTGNSGDNTLDGGTGIDTAIYSGNRANYTLTQISNGYTLKDNVGTDGTDTLTGIEFLTFADGTVIPGTNSTPTLTAFSSAVANGYENNAIAVTFADLQAHGDEADIDGTVTAFVVKTVSSGALKIGLSAATATAWDATTNNTVDATHQAYWAPAANTTGSLNAFTAVAKDNAGLESATPVQATVSVTAVPGVNKTGTSGNDNLVGGAGNDTLNGLSGNDTINGGAGNDTLDGGLGVDTLIGGLGDDTYMVDLTATGALQDTVTEAGAVGIGNDTLTLRGTSTNATAVSLMLAANLENLDASLTGNSKLNLVGNGVANTLTGNAAANILDGGLGADSLLGGDGNDTYIIDNAGDVVTEASDQGTDTVQVMIATVGATYTLTNNVENATLFNIVAFNLTGNDLDNLLIGNAAVNTLTGGLGNDTLNGDVGADTLMGGVGNDTYIVDNAADQIVEDADALINGIDTVLTSVSYTLTQNVENLTLTGTAAINATGNDLDNVLTGNSAANTLNGGAGNDTLNGGAGNDIYIVDSANDVVIESLAGSAGGIDTVKIASSYTGSSSRTAENNVENLDASLFAAGITLIGNDAVNILTGGAGNDTLDGGLGVDTLIGGLGNDTYMVDLTATGALQDTVTEAGTVGIGNDILKLRGTSTNTTTIGLTLAANLENLDASLTGNSKLNLIGNGVANTLTGNAADNILNGGIGADNLLGGDGNDTYIIDNADDGVTEAVNQGTDTVQVKIATVNATYSLTDNVETATLFNTVAFNLTGNDLDNVLIGNTAINTLIGGLGNDSLNGGGGADMLIGGAGNDTYIVDNIADRIIEDAGALINGIDTVQANVSYTLALNVENLTLTGINAINGTGNELDNILIGNSAANTLAGGAGNDTLNGGAGNDIYIVDSANDVVIESLAGSAGGIDTVKIASSYTGSSSRTAENNVENLDASLFTAGITLTGNDAVNILTGGAGNDTLDGGLGVDTLIGGLGNDTYMVDLTATGALQDTVTEAGAVGIGNDTLTLRGTSTNTTTIGLTLAGNLENLDASLTGNSKLNLIGNGVANTLTGNAADNILNGGIGADNLLGGDGNDTYIIDNAGDGVTEEVNQGTDTVQVKIATVNATYTLTDNVETATLFNTVTFNLAGNDLDNVLIGNAAINTLIGGLGNDTLIGGGGADMLIGGAGNDTYIVDNIADQIVEDAGDIDTVQASVSYTLSLNVENLTLAGSAANGIGNELDNILIGNSAANTLTGGAGNDTLNGGAGADTLQGGLDDDIYVVDNSGDKVIELADQGSDTIQASVSFILKANTENLTLTGIAAINGTGNTLDNAIIGNTASNVITGGVGTDALSGAAGNDIYLINAAAEHPASEINDSDGASDELRFASIIANETLTLYADDTGLEQVVIGTGIAAVAVSTATTALNVDASLLSNSLVMIGNAGVNHLIGTDYADTLLGGAGNDTLEAGFGNDTLNGGIGADTLIGGTGNDTYIIDSTADQIVEDTGDIDTAQASVSYTLALNVENLTLTGSGSINGTGNADGNIITGNSGINILAGNDGNDSLYGFVGNDVLNGGNGDDLLVGGAGNDRLSGGAGADIFRFNTVANASSNKDTITDFVSGTDKLQFSASVLTALGVMGQFAAADARFWASATGTAHDADDRLIYNTATGVFTYDNNGSVTGGTIQLEVLGITNHPTLTATDIWIV